MVHSAAARTAARWASEALRKLWFSNVDARWNAGCARAFASRSASRCSISTRRRSMASYRLRKPWPPGEAAPRIFSIFLMRRTMGLVPKDFDVRLEPGQAEDQSGHPHNNRDDRSPLREGQVGFPEHGRARPLRIVGGWPLVLLQVQPHFGPAVVLGAGLEGLEDQDRRHH